MPGAKDPVDRIKARVNRTAIVGNNTIDEVTVTDLGGGVKGLDVNVPSPLPVDVVGGSVGIAPITDSYAHSSANVGTVSTTIVATVSFGQIRYALILKNISDTTIWIKFDFTPAVVGQGYELLPGDTFTRDVPAAVPQAGIVGIHAGTGTKTVLVSVCDF